MAPRCTLRNSRPRLLLRLPLPIPTPLKLELLAQAPACSRLRPRCCCCCCCCRPAAVGTPYERRQNGWLHAETAGDYKRRCRIVPGFNSLIVQHVQFFLGPTDVQPVAICLIWCRVVRSRDVKSRDFSAPVCDYTIAQIFRNISKIARVRVSTNWPLTVILEEMFRVLSPNL